MATWCRRWLVAVAVPLMLAAAAGLLAQRAVVTATGADGRPVAAHVLPASGRFELRYQHSYYRVEAAEWFMAGPDGGFRLVAVGSPSQAVLDYYGLAGRTHREGRLAAAGAAPVAAHPVGRPWPMTSRRPGNDTRTAARLPPVQDRVLPASTSKGTGRMHAEGGRHDREQLPGPGGDDPHTQLGARQGTRWAGWPHSPSTPTR